MTCREAHEIGVLRETRNGFPHYRKASVFWRTLDEARDAMLDDENGVGIDVSELLKPVAGRAVQKLHPIF
jgi:hypothetical protein